MADRKPRTGEATTVNYGWTKPNVGGSDDAWGGYLNADLDGIDGTVKGVSTVANAAYPASNPAGYVTAAAIPAPYVLPTASTTVLGGVKVDGATITIAGGTISATTTGGASITVGDTAPVSPTQGALWWDSVGGQLYLWFTDANSSQWVATNNGGGPTASSTLPLANGTAAVGVSAAYARADHVHPTSAMNDNRIINGDMRIDQRNGGASGTASAYTVDRWVYSASQASKGTWGRNGPGTRPFPYNLSFTSSSAYTLLAADYFQFYQHIEADMISDFAWGTPSAQPVTLSFWVNSTLAGTFSGAIVNVPNTRSYVFTYLLQANTWTFVTLTIPGDTAGTWTMSGNGGAVGVIFDLGTGSTYRTATTNTWVAGSFNGANGAVSVAAVNGAALSMTGVKLEIGSVATPFNRQSLAKSMADCQRYYQVLNFSGSGYSNAAGTWLGWSWINAVSMRSSPTVAINTTTNTNVSNTANSLATVGAVGVSGTTTAAGNWAWAGAYNASAEL